MMQIKEDRFILRKISIVHFNEVCSMMRNYKDDNEKTNAQNRYTL